MSINARRDIPAGAIERLETRRLFSTLADAVTNDPGDVSVDDAELRAYVTAHEGLTQHVYRDARGLPVVGVGFNLKARGAKAVVQSLGLDHKQLLRDARTPETEQALSAGQIQQLLDENLGAAVDAARAAVPTFDALSHRQQVALVDLAFDAGGAAGLKAMKNVLRAVDAGDFGTAAAALLETKYARRATDPARVAADAELLANPDHPGGPPPSPSPTPSPAPSPSPSPTPGPTHPPTWLPVGKLTIEPAGSSRHAVRVAGGPVTLPDGATVNVVGDVLDIDLPEIIDRAEVAGAPGNWPNLPEGQRWPDWAMNLVPSLDTLVLGGLYRGVIPDSVVVTNEAGQVMTRDVDYKYNEDWGQLLNLNSRLGEPGTGRITASYDLVQQRLDLVQALPDGSVAVKKGESAVVCPALPEPDPGALALAGVYVYTLDGAKADGFTIQQRDIYPIDPADPVQPINPGAIPDTLAKLRAGGNVNVAFFGDSITDGAEAGQWWKDRSKTYTSLVTEGLRARFPSATITETPASEGGKGAVDSPDVFQKRVLDADAKSPVDLVVIAMGMNDKGKPTLDPFREAMRGYVEKARAAGIEVLLVTPMQSNPHYEPLQNDRVPRAEIAAAILEVAGEKRVAAVDVHAEWNNQATRGVAPFSQLHNTFNHPGEAGMRLYAETILRAFPAT